MKTRSENRTAEQPRAIRITPNYTKHAQGSVLVETGSTKVICTAFLEESVPSFLRGKGTGWVTAEYSMLPSATHTRMRRERSKVGGRTMEIQRLIGRALRSVVDFEAMGERMIQIDCDVIQADGGTRTASITGAYVALAIALGGLEKAGTLEKSPLTGQLAAISLGKVDGELVLDLDYEEDSSAEVDMNLVMTRAEGIIEVQGTAERAPFTASELADMVKMGWDGLDGHFKAQDAAIVEGLKE